MSCRKHSSEGREGIIRRIENDGWYMIKQKGSHKQFKHPTKRGKVTVPYNITKNIELSVLRQAGLRKREQ